MSSIEIESADVIRLIQQYLKEANLPRALHALSEETGVALNTVDSVEALAGAVTSGHWDAVLRQARALRLSERVAADLYELAALELCELRELATARALLRAAPAQRALRPHAERLLRLEALLARPYFDAREAYGAGGRERRRAALAAALAQEVAVVPPARLLALLGQALRWQQQQGLLPPGAAIDLFRGKAAVRDDADDRCVAQLSKTIRFGARAHVETARFSPDGQLLVTGAADGLVEVWNFATGKARKDLRYQARDETTCMEAAVLALAFARDSDALAAGDGSGAIRAWRVHAAAAPRRIPRAHAKGVTALAFSKDAAQLLSASFDKTIRIHGMKSGKLLKQFLGHTSFVNEALWTGDGHGVVSASSDGTVRVWAARSGECSAVLRPRVEASAAGPPGGGAPGGDGAGAPEGDAPALQLLPAPALPDHYFVVTRSSCVALLSLAGHTVRSFGTGRRPSSSSGAGREPHADAALAAAALSPRARLLYAAGGDGVLYAFCAATGKLERTLTVHEKPVIGLAHHPHQNLLATYSEDGTLKLWKP